MGFLGSVFSLGFLLLFGVLFGRFIATTPNQIPLILSVAFSIFIIAFFRMDIALILVIIAMLLSPELAVGSIPKRDIVIRVEDLLIVVLGVAWLARSAVYKGLEIVPRTSINRWVGFYCAAFFIATVQGVIVSGVNPLQALFYFLKYLEYFILFYITVGTIKTRKNIAIFLGVLLLTFAIVNVYATFQVGSGRVSAPFEGERGEPNTLGGYQVLMLCVTLGLFCHARTRFMSAIYALLAILTVWPFLHTLSRASYLAIVPAYIALIWYNKSKRKPFLILLFMVIILLVIFFTPQEVRERIFYTFRPQYQEGIPTAEFFGLKIDPSSSARWWDWQEAIRYWAKSPFFGYGLTGRSFLDGQYINNLVEQGALGLIAFLFLIWNLQRQILRVYRFSEDSLVRGLSLGFAAGNVGILFHALTVNTFILIRIMEPYWFMAAMIMAAARLEEASPSEARSSRRFRNIDLVVGKLSDDHSKEREGSHDAT